MDNIEQRLKVSINHKLISEQSDLGGTLAKLSALNPQKILERGFAVVSNAEGQPIQKLAQSKVGMPISVRVSDGEFAAEIKKKNKRKK